MHFVSLGNIKAKVLQSIVTTIEAGVTYVKAPLFVVVVLKRLCDKVLIYSKKKCILRQIEMHTVN